MDSTQPVDCLRMVLYHTLQGNHVQISCSYSLNIMHLQIIVDKVGVWDFSKIDTKFSQ